MHPYLVVRIIIVPIADTKRIVNDIRIKKSSEKEEEKHYSKTVLILSNV